MANYNCNFIEGNATNGFRDSILINVDGDTCIIDVPDWINGKRSFVCTSGETKKLSNKGFTSIEHILQIYKRDSLTIKAKRTLLEILNKQHGKEFYDWKDRLDWLYSEVGITNNNELVAMYPKLDINKESLNFN